MLVCVYMHVAPYGSVYNLPCYAFLCAKGRLHGMQQVYVEMSELAVAFDGQGDEPPW